MAVQKAINFSHPRYLTMCSHDARHRIDEASCRPFNSALHTSVGKVPEACCSASVRKKGARV